MFNSKLCIMRPEGSKNASEMAKFAMLKHSQAKENHHRFNKLTHAIENQEIDGLNNIDMHSKIIQIAHHKLFTHLVIEVNVNI